MRSLPALILACAFLSGCAADSPGGDKAGGVRGGAVVLTLASTEENLAGTPAVAEFVRGVARRSDGALRIRVVGRWGGYAPDSEAQVVQAVGAGRVDLGSTGSGAFDDFGLRPLEAPLLVDSLGLERAVIAGPLPGRLLGGLRDGGVVGLALLANGFRLPIGARRPLRSTGDWRGVSFGVEDPELEADTVRALGAKPVVTLGPFRRQDLVAGRIQGFALDLRSYTQLGLARDAPFVTANIALWPEFDVLFANPGRLASLTHEQRVWLRQAAADAESDSVSVSASGRDTLDAACAVGARFADASPKDLAGLRRSFARLYRELESDPAGDAVVRDIEHLKRSLPHDPGPSAGGRCPRRG
jgi:TRAP-type C4-dicarboxylate transport system substrate-binding protein